MQPLDPVPRPLVVAESVPAASRQLVRDMPHDGPGTDLDSRDPPGLAAPPTMSALLSALQRRWVLALCVAGLGAVLGIAAVVQFFPARYTVQARFEVPACANSPSFFAVGAEDFPHFKNKVASLVKSPGVLDAALNDKDVQALGGTRDRSGTVDWLETALKTDYLLGPEILRVSLSGDRPEELATLVNAVGAALIAELEQRERSRQRTLLAELQANQRVEEEKLRQKQIALRKLEDQRGLEDVDTAKVKFLAALNELGTLRKACVSKRQDQITTQEEIHSLQAREKSVAQASIPPEQYEEFFRTDLSVQTFLQEKGRIQKEIVDIQRVAPGSTALIADRQQALERTDRALQRLKEKLRVDVDRELRDRLQGELKAAASNLQDRLKMLKTQETELGREVRRMEEDAQKLNPSSRPRSAEMLSLENEVTYTQAALQDLGKKIAMLAVEPATGSRVVLVQKAAVPQRKDSSRQTKMAGAAGIGMFGVLLLGVAFWEFRARKISHASEVVRGLGLSLMGTVPSLPVRALKPLVQGGGNRERAWQSQLCEAVDSIRTRLLHTSRGGAVKIVMVTSAVSGEGKTALASQLAASLARARKNTLLVDGDLRHPAIHQACDVALTPGLSEILRGEIAPANAVHATPTGRLWVMPAGRRDTEAIQALAQDLVGPLFVHLKEKYDFVIVDSSPVLPVTDSLVLGQHVDAVLFSILRGVSRMPAVYAAQQCLHELAIPLLGAVVVGTKVDPGNAAYMTPTHVA